MIYKAFEAVLFKLKQSKRDEILSKVIIVKRYYLQRYFQLENLLALTF